MFCYVVFLNNTHSQTSTFKLSNKWTNIKFVEQVWYDFSKEISFIRHKTFDFASKHNFDNASNMQRLLQTTLKWHMWYLNFPRKNINPVFYYT